MVLVPCDLRQFAALSRTKGEIEAEPYCMRFSFGQEFKVIVIILEG